MDFLSAPSNFLAQWFHNFDSKILGLTMLSMKNGRTGVCEKTLLRKITHIGYISFESTKSGAAEQFHRWTAGQGHAQKNFLFHRHRYDQSCLCQAGGDAISFRLKHNLHVEGLNSHVPGDFPGSFESTNLWLSLFFLLLLVLLLLLLLTSWSLVWFLWWWWCCCCCWWWWW